MSEILEEVFFSRFISDAIINNNYNSLAEVGPNENDIELSTTSALSSSSTMSVINNVASGGGEQTSTATTTITEQ